MLNLPPRLAAHAAVLRGALHEGALRAGLAPSRMRDLPGSLDSTVLLLGPGADIVNGGLLSIATIADETEALLGPGGPRVLMCTLPGDPFLDRYTRFDCARPLYPLSAVLPRLSAEGVHLVHVPELWTARVGRWFEARKARLPQGVRFNILLQNIDLCPARADVDRLRAFGPLSCSTAHEAYTSAAMAERLGVPTHLLGVILSAKRFERRPEAEKSRLMLFSPDPHPCRDAVIARAREGLPDVETRIIRGLTYREYKAAIAAARHTLTFGEGLDGYFVESIFSGAVSIAVYNDRFFTPDFVGCPGVFPSWDDLMRDLPTFLQAMRDPARFADVQARQFALVDAIYDGERYTGRLEALYRDYHPMLLKKERT